MVIRLQGHRYTKKYGFEICETGERSPIWMKFECFQDFGSAAYVEIHKDQGENYKKKEKIPSSDTWQSYG